MIRAVIFDMDGTVVDSTRIDYEAWQKVFKEHNYDFSYKEYLRVLGAKGSEIVNERLDLPEEEVTDMLSRKEDFFKELTEERGLGLIPHVEQLLNQVKSIPLKIALATGSEKDKMEAMLEKFKLKEFFDVRFSAKDVKEGKPEPEIFLRAAEELGVSPEECIVMEDAPNGVEAAKNAGMRCIAITSTHKQEELKKADLIVNSFQELNIRDFIEKH